MYASNYDVYMYIAYYGSVLYRAWACAHLYKGIGISNRLG